MDVISELQPTSKGKSRMMREYHVRFVRTREGSKGQSLSFIEHLG